MNINEDTDMRTVAERYPLKPCPFCGSNARFTQRAKNQYAVSCESPWHLVTCPLYCDGNSWSAPSYEEAAEIWNTRKGENGHY